MKAEDVNMGQQTKGFWFLSEAGGLWPVFVSCVLCLASSFSFAQNTEDIKDIRPPVSYPMEWIFWIILVSSIALSVLVFFLWKRFRNSSQRIRVDPPQPAWDAARNALAVLTQKKYPEKNQVKPYYFELSYILRQYTEARFSLNAPDMTTEEFLDSLKYSRTLNEDQKSRLQNFLMSCDMVKFAKYGSNMDDMDQSFALVEKFIEETIIKDIEAQ